MYYKLYIDSVFILQITGNFYLLSLTGMILGCTATHKRIWFGAAAGALWEGRRLIGKILAAAAVLLLLPAEGSA